MNTGKIYTTKEVAHLVGLTTSAIIHAIRRGQIKTEKFGTSYIITEQALAEYLEYRRAHMYERRE